MKLAPQDEWLRPYINSAGKLVPLKKLYGVRGFKVALDRLEDADGRIATSDFRKFVITVRVDSQAWKHAGKGKFKAVRHSPRTLEDVLFTLAHEMAHIKYWAHTHNHALLSARILARFYKTAQKLGVTDFQAGHTTAHKEMHKQVVQKISRSR